MKNLLVKLGLIFQDPKMEAKYLKHKDEQLGPLVNLIALALPFQVIIYIVRMTQKDNEQGIIIGYSRFAFQLLVALFLRKRRTLQEFFTASISLGFLAY